MCLLLSELLLMTITLASLRLKLQWILLLVWVVLWLLMPMTRRLLRR
jgi:hypothetical protein